MINDTRMSRGSASLAIHCFANFGGFGKEFVPHSEPTLGVMNTLMYPGSSVIPAKRTRNVVTDGDEGVSWKFIQITHKWHSYKFHINYTNYLGV